MAETGELVANDTIDRFINEAVELVLAVVMRQMGLSKEEAATKFDALSPEDKERFGNELYTCGFTFLNM